MFVGTPPALIWSLVAITPTNTTGVQQALLRSSVAYGIFVDIVVHVCKYTRLCIFSALLYITNGTRQALDGSAMSILLVRFIYPSASVFVTA